MYINVKKGDTGTYITFASSSPHKTRTLLISFMEEDNKPTNLLDDLKDVGWVKENGPFPLIEFPSLTNPGRREITLYANGSDPCGMWTYEETERNLRNSRRVLKAHGFTGVPHRKLTYADMA